MRWVLVFVTGFVLVRGTAWGQQEIVGRGNPILADGSVYSADPAPLVVGNTLYVIAGQDAAGPAENDFVMPAWQMFATRDVLSRRWEHWTNFLRPEAVFRWAAPGHAYGAQMVQGPDGRFYLYAPVMEAGSTSKDPFAIGVAVADGPLGPWRDAHPAGPVISETVPVANAIENIDPTVWVDADGRVFLYWGTFGRLRAMEMQRDMVTPKGPEVAVTGLTGFFEAPWLFRRGDTYYMVYAGNQAGPDSVCTPAVYHACLEYGTAPGPMGPWTWRGVLLKPVSSTTSHSGVVLFQAKWWLVYHTADAVGGGHFRRSVAIDEVQWDDTVRPAAMRLVVPTRAPQAEPAPSRNLAGAARASASNEPVPVQYWIAALNDGVVRENPLPPDMWASWAGEGKNPAQAWVEYRWSRPVELDGARMRFWADHPTGSGEGIAPPKAWHLEWWDGVRWQPVQAKGPYGTSAEEWNAVAFAPVKTERLRAVVDASQAKGTTAGVAIEEWEALSPKAVRRAEWPVVPGR